MTRRQPSPLSRAAAMHGGDLRRQVGVVVDERGPAIDAPDVESAGHATESGERCDARRERHADAIAMAMAPVALTHVVDARNGRSTIPALCSAVAVRARRRSGTSRRSSETSTARTSASSARPYVIAPWRGGQRRRRGSSAHSTFGPATCARYRSKLSTMRLERAVVVEVVDLDVESRACRPAAARGACRRSRRPRRPASSPPVHCAPVPASLTSPPTMKLGASPASARISMSIDVVVVLPCVPATPSDRARAQIAASMPARRRTGMPSRCAARHSMFERRDRRRDGHRVAASDEGRVVTDVDVHARRPHPVERGCSRRSLPETWWPISASTMAMALIPGPRRR